MVEKEKVTDALPKWMTEEFHADYPYWVKAEKNGTMINGCHVLSLKVASLDTSSADVYSFRFEEPFGWAIFSINNLTGEFHIQSDWGNWQYRWNTDSLGESHQKSDKPLTHFFAVSGDAGYVTDKLHYSRERNRFSEKETKKEIKAEITRARRSMGIDKEEAETVWDQLDNLDWSTTDSFFYSLRDEPELDDFLQDAHEYIRMEPTSGYILLQYKLLPFFFEYLRREVIGG